MGQPSAKQFMPEPHPIGVENVALAVLSNLPDVKERTRSRTTGLLINLGKGATEYQS